MNKDIGKSGDVVIFEDVRGYKEDHIQIKCSYKKWRSDYIQTPDNPWLERQRSER